MADNGEKLKRLARRFDVPVEDLLAAAARPGFGEQLAETVEPLLEAADAVDQGAREAADPAVASTFREQAEQLRATARRNLGRAAEVREI